MTNFQNYKKMLLIIPAAVAIIAIMIATDILAFSDKPWREMTCEQMKDYAIDPKHYNLSENEHRLFHMEIDKCI